MIGLVPAGAVGLAAVAGLMFVASCVAEALDVDWSDDE